MARAGLDIKAAASFHGLLGAPEGAKPKKIKSKVLVAHGWDDPMVSHDDVVAIGHELTAAKCDWQIHAYGGTGHSFTNPEADDKKNKNIFNEDSARRSTLAAQDLLQEVFAMHNAIIAS
jgi:dienelactone hydrolase